MFQEVRQNRRSLKEILPRKPLPPPPSSGVLPVRPVSPSVTPPPIPPVRHRTGLRPFSIFITSLFVLVIVGVALFVITATMSGAQVVITPKTLALSFENTAITYAPVELMSLQPITESINVRATGVQKIVTKATGKVILYNSFSTTAQKLIKNTRLQAKNGRIYRLTDAVSVPGYKKSGTTITPGQIEATIVAEEAGEAYNSAPTDFTLPAYKADARYTKLYARSSAAISGGSNTEQLAVSESDKQAANNALKDKLNERISTQARFQIPKNFILYDDGIFVTLTQKVEAVGSSTAEAKITTTANVKALLFEESRLTNLLLASAGVSSSSVSYTIPALRTLKVTLPNKATVNVASDKSVALTVTGTPTAVAQIDTAKLGAALAGQSKQQAETIFKNFASISAAQVTLTPPWLRRFPKNSTTNKIELQLPVEPGLTP